MLQRICFMNGFPPVGSARPRILILGSFPSVISLEKGQYYGNARNHFWEVLGIVLDESFPEEYRARVALLAPLPGKAQHD